MANNTIRQSQALHTYGPGAIGDFPEISLMFLSHDAGAGTHWGTTGNMNPKRRVNLYDKRLSDAFGVSRFVYPPIDSGVLPKNLISTIRFPFSLYCSNSRCGRIYNTNDLKNSSDITNSATFDLNQTGYICPDCFQNYSRVKNKLIPTRFVIATEEGFIDDFPWDWYVHKDHPQQRGKDHKLYLKFTGSSSSLSSIRVESSFQVNGQRISKSLEGIFDQELTFMSRGNDYLRDQNNYMPAPWKGWKGINQKLESLYRELISDVPELRWDSDGKVDWTGGTGENRTEAERRAKRKYPRTLQRGAGNLYFPILFKAILLPLREGESDFEKYTSLLNEIVDEMIKDKLSEMDTEEEKNDFGAERKIAFLNRDNRFERIAAKFFSGQGEVTLEREVFVNYLDARFAPEIDNQGPSGSTREKLRKDEFECFTDESLTEDSQRWYKATHIPGSAYGTLGSFIDKVVLLDQLNEIKIFRGFTRIRPLNNEDLIFESEASRLDPNKRNELERIQDARKDPLNTDELPCVDVKGEGIFIKFNDALLDTWAQLPEVRQRIQKLQNNVDRYDEVFQSESRAVNPRYVLLHSVSHMLLRELSMDSGYSLSSLGEIIYCDHEGTGPMNGILIYTSANDSEGTLGGLVEKGSPEYLEKLFIKALDRMKWCSSDPLCITTEQGQGFMGLNLSACHACSLLPETACESMNKFLDRALLVGTLNEDSRMIGFFNEKLI